MSSIEHSESVSRPPQSFDDILDAKVGFGKYQILLYLIVGMAFAAEAAFIYCFSLVVPIVANQWGLDEGTSANSPPGPEVCFLGSTVFIGIFIGSVTASMITDKMGRKKFLLLANTIQMSIGLCSYFLRSYAEFVTLRIAMGVVIGFTLPLCLSILSEITTVNYRGKALIFCNIFFTTGRLLVILFAFLTLENLTEGAWQKTILCCALLPALVITGALLYVKESPRFEIAFGRVDYGVKILEEIGKINKGDDFVPLDSKDVEDLRIWAKTAFVKSESAGFSSLFTKEYFVSTINLWMMWLTAAFVSYGLNFILPFVLNDIGQGSTQTGFLELAVPNLTEIPTIVVGILIIEVKIFGRKNTLIICFFLCFLCYIFAEFLPNVAMIPLVSMGRFFISLAFGTLYPFSAELYSTKNRTLGIGLASAIGRFGTAAMPWIGILVMNWHIKAPFGIFAIMCLLSALLGLTVRYDTAGRQLDNIEQEDAPENVGKGNDSFDVPVTTKLLAKETSTSQRSSAQHNGL